MNEVMVFEGTELERIEYQGQPVLSLPMVAQIHKKETKRVWENFKRNSDRFIEGEDYYDLPQAIWSTFISAFCGYERGQSGYEKKDNRGWAGNMIFLTVSGYLQIATTFTDEFSWKVRKMLVRSYFKLKELMALAGDVVALKEKAEKFDALILEHTALLKKHISLLEVDHTHRRINLTREEREEIIDLAKKGLTTTPIMRETGRSKSAIQKVLRAARAAGLLPATADETYA